MWLAANVIDDVLIEGSNTCSPARFRSAHPRVHGGRLASAAGYGRLMHECRRFQRDDHLRKPASKHGWRRCARRRQLESDPENDHTVDANGRVAYAAISDWFNFSHRQRHWGRPPSSDSFPNMAAIGRCDTASGCAYWDWRVSAKASLLRDPLEIEGPWPAALDLPINVRRHVWSAASGQACQLILEAVWTPGAEPECVTPFLAYGFEPPDEIDNENFLCETGERCFFNRNRGAYPGGEHPGGPYRQAIYPEEGTALVRVDPDPEVENEDDFVEPPPFNDVRLWRYTTNGD